MNWYLNFDSDTSRIPSGANKVPFLQVPTDPAVWTSGNAAAIESLTDQERDALGFFTSGELSQMAQDAPGSYWYIFGEANRYFDVDTGEIYMTGTRFAPVFHYYYTWIKKGDPDAMIIGTSILNWDYTCIGCGGLVPCVDTVLLPGYQCGEKWLKEFIEAYKSMYEERPPVDVWAIDAYPLDWDRTPNSDMHAQIVIDQLLGMREYLNSVPEYVNTPIWITEIAVHVGYGDFGSDNGNLFPIGDYHWDKMSDYMVAVLEWLDDNAADNMIDKWFFFITWIDIVEIGPDGYMGIIFFENPQEGSPRNCLGDTYRSWALQYLAQPPAKVRCDAQGETL